MTYEPLADLDLERVAYALAREVAKKWLAADPKFRRLDALGQAAALHETARNMAPELKAEAEACVDAVRAQLIEARKPEGCDA